MGAQERGATVRRLVLSLGVVVAFLASGIITWAAIETVRSTSDGDVIVGCYLSGSGQLRIVNDASECKKSETPISWNQTGPAGPPGPPGPVAVSHVEVDALLGPGETDSAVASCPSPKIVTGGGFEAPADVDVLESVPAYGGGRLSAWRVTAVNDGSGSATLTAHAVCALGGTPATPPSMDLIVDSLTTWSVSNKGNLVAPGRQFKAGDTIAIVAHTVNEGGEPLSGSQVFLEVCRVGDACDVPVTSLQGFSDTDGDAVTKWKTLRGQASGDYRATVVDVINDGYHFRPGLGQTTATFTIR
jgi:hypothetical protein